MNLNYDQFNGDALIFKYNLDEYGNPISIKVDKEEKQVSVHGTIQLEYVPDEYNRVIILNENNTQMTEVFNRDEIMPNTYYIDYNNGVAYLDKSQFGKTKIYNYYKKGIQLIGCSRIYDEHDVTGKHVVLTLQEIIDAGKEALRFLLDIGDAKKVIELLESLIAEGNLTITNLENKKNECIQAIDDAISQATQDKNEIVEEIQENIQEALDSVINVAGNKEAIIKSSQWALNGDVYEKEIAHDLNSENLHLTAKNSDTKEACTIGYKILDKTRILLKSDEAINMSVILSASYYHATQTISDDIAEEVVKARKGEASLDVKITKIDEQLDTKESKEEVARKAYKEYVDTQDADLLRQIGQGVTDEQLKNAVQSKINDGSIASLAVGEDSVRPLTLNNGAKSVEPLIWRISKDSILKNTETITISSNVGVVYRDKFIYVTPNSYTFDSTDSYLILRDVTLQTNPSETHTPIIVKRVNINENDIILAYYSAQITTIWDNIIAEYISNIY